MSKHTVELTSQNFETEVLQSDIPVVVDFWATWCGPCQMTAPVFEQVAEELAGKVKFCKVNIDEQSGLAEQFRVMSIPTFILFKDGAAFKKQVGALPKDTLVQFVNQAL